MQSDSTTLRRLVNSLRELAQEKNVVRRIWLMAKIDECCFHLEFQPVFEKTKEMLVAKSQKKGFRDEEHEGKK